VPACLIEDFLEFPFYELTKGPWCVECVVQLRARRERSSGMPYTAAMAAACGDKHYYRNQLMRQQRATQATEAQRNLVLHWLMKPDIDLFEQVDTNKDGFITAAELRQHVETDATVFKSDVVSLCGVVMEMADTDKDGKINIAEFQKLRTVLKVNEKLKADLGVVGYGLKAPTSLDELAQHEWQSTKSTNNSAGCSSSNEKITTTVTINPNGTATYVEKKDFNEYDYIDDQTIRYEETSTIANGAVECREKQIGGSGGSLEPPGLFFNPLGLFLRTLIPFSWRIMSAFLRA
jgi:hypothetical protein